MASILGAPQRARLLANHLKKSSTHIGCHNSTRNVITRSYASQTSDINLLLSALKQNKNQPNSNPSNDSGEDAANNAIKDARTKVTAAKRRFALDPSNKSDGSVQSDADFGDPNTRPAGTSVKISAIQTMDKKQIRIQRELYATETPAGKPIRNINPMKDLKYFKLYPKTIQRWVGYTQMPKGRYVDGGYWKNDRRAHLEQQRAMAVRRKEAAEKPRDEVAEKNRILNQKPLAPDLIGKYRFGVQPEEINSLNPKLREFFTFRYATNQEINNFRIHQAIEKWQTQKFDTGSPGPTVAVLTEKVNYLTKHMLANRQDKKTKYRLQLLIGKRHRLMMYVKRKNAPLYFSLLKEYGIKDIL